MSPIEQSIKAKIEKIGTPLKDWDINIYRGVLTGFNDAFIISGEKRDEILANCKNKIERKKTAELIRPILRGRDIKRFSYTWADLWLIYIPWHFPLQFDQTIQGASKKAEDEFQKQYPSVYAHLLSYKKELSARNKAETGIRYEWYAMQRWGSNYWDDFNKPKLVYPETTQGAFFAYDEDGIYIDKTCFMMTGKDKKTLKYLQKTLSSRLFEFAYKSIFSSIELGQNGYQYNKHALIKLPIINKVIDLPNNENEINNAIFQLYNLNAKEIELVNTHK